MICDDFEDVQVSKIDLRSSKFCNFPLTTGYIAQKYIKPQQPSTLIIEKIYLVNVCLHLMLLGHSNQNQGWGK